MMVASLKSEKAMGRWLIQKVCEVVHKWSDADEGWQVVDIMMKRFS